MGHVFKVCRNLLAKTDNCPDFFSQVNFVVDLLPEREHTLIIESDKTKEQTGTEDF